MITLTIPFPTPSLNKLHGQHWSRLYRERKKWAWLVRAARLEANAEPSNWQRAKVTIERYGAQILDKDNFIAGAKALVDCLRREGFFADDSPAHLESHYVQHVGEPRRTVVHMAQMPHSAVST